MRSTWLAGLSALLPSCATGLTAPASPPSAGPLVIVGGGGTPDEVVARTIELAGGRSARAIVLAQASARPEAGEESVAFWREKGLEDVTDLDLSDPAASRAAIAAADLIWFPGGDQSRLLGALEAADLAGAIRARHAAGAVVGGTSAGAAILSQRMIVGGETADLTVVRAKSVLTEDGLDLLPGTILDQHFLKRRRFNRLLSAVLEHPDLVGIGIDERTAIVVTGTTFEVVGESGVLVLDGREASVDVGEGGAPAAATDVRLTLLRGGMRHDLSIGNGRACHPPDRGR